MRRKTKKQKEFAPTINPRHTRVPLRIDCSAIHSVGVFADEEIPRGTKMIRYTGEHITQQQAIARIKRLWGKNIAKPRYLLRLNPKWIIDGAVGGSGAERINHSCDPNVLERYSRGTIWFYSRRRIRRDEELTLDYRFTPTTPHIPCRCGARNCRGTMNAPAKQPARAKPAARKRKA